MKLRLLLSLFFVSAALAFTDDVQKVSAAHAAKLIAAGNAVLVDVREAPEWADSGVAAPAALLAKSDFDGKQETWKPFLEKNAGKEIILYCRSGSRSAKVAEALAAKGWKVSNAGGFKDWVEAGLPVRKVDEKIKAEEKK